MCEAVAAFDFRRDQLKIKWLKQFLNAGFSVSEGGSRRWLVSLVYPTGVLALVVIALIEIPQACSLKFLTCEPGQCSGWRVPVVARRRVSAAAWWSRSR